MNRTHFHFEEGTLPLPLYSGGEGWGEGGQNPWRRYELPAWDTLPLTPNPSPPSTGERGGYKAQVHRPCGLPVHNQMIQSTFFGSPPKSLRRVMHWPRWCWACIAAWTRASAMVITQGGSGNQGIRTVQSEDGKLR